MLSANYLFSSFIAEKWIIHPMIIREAEWLLTVTFSNWTMTKKMKPKGKEMRIEMFNQNMLRKKKKMRTIMRRRTTDGLIWK